MDSDTETIIICALRYAFTRRSYMPTLVADYIVDRFLEMSEGRQEIAIADIREHIEDAELFGAYRECDAYILRYWKNTLHKLKTLKTNNS